MSKKLILPAVFAVTTVSILGGLLAWRTSKQDNCNTILNSYGENHACILTNSGSMVFELYKDAAPKSIDKLKKISNEDKFYDNLEFYRVAKDFVIQGGIQDLKIKNRDSKNLSDEINKKFKLTEENIETESNFEKLALTDEEKKALADEKFTSNESLNTRKFEYGSLSFANAGAGTNSTEIFIVTSKDINSSNLKYLNGRFTNMGKIIKGQDLLDKLNNYEINPNYTYSQDKPKKLIKIIEIRVK